MKNNIILLAAILCIAMTITGCNTKSDVKSDSSVTQSESVVATTSIQRNDEVTANTEAAQEKPLADNKFDVSWETIAEADISPDIYKMSGGLWYYMGKEDDKSIDMDGLKGFTAYTKEAIPETDGYLLYLGTNPDGLHVFEIFDIFGQHFTTMTFVSEEKFYLGDDEENFYLKFDF